jgi:hypothetical protein
VAPIGGRQVPGGHGKDAPLLVEERSFYQALHRTPLFANALALLRFAEGSKTDSTMNVPASRTGLKS